MSDEYGDQRLWRRIPWRSRALYVIIASSLMGVMGVSLISPVLPIIRPAFGVTDSEVGWLLTAYTLPGIFITPFVGLVADRLGRKTVLLPLLFIFGIAGSAIAFVNSFTAVLGLRFIQGIGASGLVTLAVTLIGDLYTGSQRDALMGINGSLIGTGAAFYPLLGGGLAAIRWNMPFLFFSVGILVGIFALIVLEEGDTSASMTVREYLNRIRLAAIQPQSVAIFSAILIVFFVFYGTILTGLPLLLNDEFGLGTEQIGPVLAVVAIASAVVSSQYGRFAAWRSAPELVAIGFISYGASLLFIWIAPSVIWIGVALLLFGVGFGLVMPSIDTTIITLVSDDLRAGMMGMRTSMLRLGQTLGPVGITAIAETFFATTVEGYFAAFLISGIIILTAGVGSYVLLRNR
ncbi:MFS transporter [Salinarchaeum sp. IM2453]|uniref:MFS transporter n=1 Tax=Salinarchaeum sp. IM2453 TaxID=2862870 RepID=UPI001C82E2D5|nr:MFS transporter [Salinarchaeum sp. IM2453]QZA88365.1 MFS transporter [Salinarchaeum sp. IM2453]